MSTNETTRRSILAAIAAAPATGLLGGAEAAPIDEKILTTAEDFAAFEFEPWPADLLALCEPPNNDKWTEVSLAHLIFIRVAWAMLHQTKDEMIDRLRDIDNETGMSLFDGFKAAVDFHKQTVKILEAAEGRLLVAGSFLEVNEWEARS